jgi:hypothetical protein
MIKQRCYGQKQKPPDIIRLVEFTSLNSTWINPCLTGDADKWENIEGGRFSKRYLYVSILQGQILSLEVASLDYSLCSRASLALGLYQNILENMIWVCLI